MRRNRLHAGALAGLAAPVLALAMLAAACSRPPASTPPTPTPLPSNPFSALSPAPTPQPIEFPRDEAPHTDALEWWYYNGHLEDDKGNAYGFHFVVFQARSPGAGGSYAYLSNMGIADLAQEEHQQAARVSIQTQPQPDEGFVFTLNNWTLTGDPAAHSFSAHTQDYALNLTMTPLKPAAFHDEDGFLTGPEGWTYYYSWTRMEASGSLTIDGTPVSVRGSAWMDHQWGDFVVRGYPSGWQWFALQLDDGRELMVTEARDNQGKTVLYGTLVAQDGSTAHLQPNDLSLDILDYWQSPETQARYPSGWRLKVLPLDIDLELQPILKDPEITAVFPLSTIYWEGPVTIEGTEGGRPVGGKAFVELVGYVQALGFSTPR